MLAFRNHNMKPHCSYRIGGLAELMYFPEYIEEMIELVRKLQNTHTPFWIHGAGANTLFPDGRIRIPIISTSALTGHTQTAELLTAEAGIPLDAWVLKALQNGFAGVECLSGIPGSLGGALFMNAGAYGQEIADHLLSVTTISPDGTVKELSKKDCDYSYRQAKGLQGHFILQGTWRLPSGDPQVLQHKRQEILQKRKEKQPLEFPSAGSVFKRPDGAYASELLDRAGLKGLRIGGAQISEKHAGFIVNTGGATCEDVLQLIEHCRQTVAERFGYQLELEQQICPCQSTAK